MYEGTSDGQLSKLGAFPEPCPNMHILPDGVSPSMPFHSSTVTGPRSGVAHAIIPKTRCQLLSEPQSKQQSSSQS